MSVNLNVKLVLRAWYALELRAIIAVADKGDGGSGTIVASNHNYSVINIAAC